MNIQQLKKLVEESYKRDSLAMERVKKITKALKRKELKQYIRMLKAHEAKKNVDVWSPSPLSVAEKVRFSKKFKSKKINYKVDPALGLGVKIIHNDDIYDFTLRTELEDMVSQLV